MSKRRLADATFVELVTVASEALLEKGRSGQQLSDWVLDILELQQERSTLRDRFAEAALAALLPTMGSEALQKHGPEYLLEKTAFTSYKMADAMLKARKETEK